MDALPSALADILGRVVADERKAWHGARAHIEAEARATIAEFRAEIAELKGQLRTVHDGEVQALRAAVARVDDAIAMVRDGRDGEPGPAGPAGEKGEAGRDADPEVVADLVLKRLPPPERGEPGPAGPQGEPGQDADPAVIEALVSERLAKAVAELPLPEKGDPGPPGEKGADADPETVAELVLKRLPPPERGEPGPAGETGPPGPAGEQGEPGKDADPDAMAVLVAEHVEKTAAQFPDFIRRTVDDVVAGLPPPERGERGPPGEKGADADPALVDALVSERVAEAVADLPPPERGEPGPAGPQGEPGPQGERGDPGADGRGIEGTHVNSDGELVFLMTDDAMVNVGSILGPTGPEGAPGKRGEKGEPGTDGRDGVGLAGAMIGRKGELVLTLTDGTTRDLDIVVGRDGAPGPQGERGAPGEPGRDGQGIDPELVLTAIREEVAKLPIPEKGDPGPPGEPGPVGPAGRAGKDADPDEMARRINEAVTKAVAELPPPERGPQGEPGPQGATGHDGKDADPIEVAALITDDVTKVVAEITLERMPKPERGADGRGIENIRLDDGLFVVELTDGSEKAIGAVAGPPGEPGRDGKDGRDADPAVSIIDSVIDANGNLHLILSDKSVLIPGRVVGAPGRDGVDGASGSVGARGEKGDPGPAGRDGAGLAGAFIDREGSLILTLSDGKVCNLDRVVGRDGAPGAPGADGRDGLSFESFNLDPDYDGERTITLKWTDAAGKEQTRTWRLPLVIDRGIYKAGEEYDAGDAVTFGGSVWIAQKATATKPGNGNPDWRLAVKSGRDGRDGKDGAKGDRGPPGPPSPGFLPPVPGGSR